MKKSIYSIFAVFVAMIVIVNIANSAAVKRVVIEQFTGAWCGYCPDGTVKMDEIIAANPGRVIGVKFHEGDGMEISETGEIGSALGLGGYPTGNVDRTPFNVGGQTKIMLDRGAWSSAVNNNLSLAGIADIKLQWTYDQSTNKIMANISATFDQGVSEELRFNVYVLEDDVVGSGSGWDQTNNYNGVSGHPFYGLGNPVKNYHHMKVVRACLGGAWGKENSIVNPVSSGSTSKYTFEFQKSASWNIDKIQLIGLVQVYSANSRRILNAAEGQKVTSTTAITSTGDELFVKPVGESNELNISIKNNGSSTKEYTLNITKATGTTWSTSIEPNEYVISVPPAQTYNFTFKMNVTTAGSGQAILNIEEDGGMSFSRTLKGYSQNLNMLHVLIDPAGDASGMGNVLKSFAEYTTFQSIPYGDFTQLYSKFPNLQLVYYNTGDGGTLSSTDNSVLQSLINKKVNLVFSGPLVFKSFNDNLQQISGQLGFGWNQMSFQGQSSNGRFNIEGITGDEISNGFSSQIQIYYFLHKARITDPSVCSKIVTLSGNADSIFAVKTQLPESRAVVFGFHPMGLQNTTARNNLIYNALKWVFTTVPAEKPEIAVPSGISFDEVAIDMTSEKPIKIENAGKKDLVISNAEIKNNVDGAYSIIDYGLTTIKPGESTNMIIKFAPSAIKFYSSTTVEIASNDPLKAKAVVQLSGKGGKAGSVEELAHVNLSINPIPVVSNATISFVIPDNSRSNLLNVIDLNGKTVLEVGSNYPVGINNLKFEPNNLTSGNYFLMLEIDGEILTHKFTVNK